MFRSRQNERTSTRDCAKKIHIVGESMANGLGLLEARINIMENGLNANATNRWRCLRQMIQRRAVAIQALADKVWAPKWWYRGQDADFKAASVARIVAVTPTMTVVTSKIPIFLSTWQQLKCIETCCGYRVVSAGENPTANNGWNLGYRFYRPQKSAVKKPILPHKKSVDAVIAYADFLCLKAKSRFTLLLTVTLSWRCF